MILAPWRISKWSSGYTNSAFSNAALQIRKFSTRAITSSRGPSIFGGYGFHIYDDSGARWITIRYETEDAATKARDLIAKALAIIDPNDDRGRPRKRGEISTG